jgi:predicted Zn-dependent protease
MTTTSSNPVITSTREQASGWKDSVAEIRSELDQGNIDAAVAALSSAMIQHGEQIWMLVTGHDVYRTAGQEYTALLYAEKLISLYPSEYHGYCRTVQTLTKLQRNDAALEIMKLH